MSDWIWAGMCRYRSAAIIKSNINFGKMDPLKLIFWPSIILCPIFIIWGGIDFVQSPSHGTSHLFFIIGLLLLLKSLVLVFIIKRTKNKRV